MTHGRDGQRSLLALVTRGGARIAQAGMGYTVLEANAPGEALRAAGTHQAPIHLLLTDVIMPG